MRANVGLSDKQMKFVRLAATNELSLTECHRRAGYSGDTANASKLAKSLAEFISAERTRLGLPEPDSEEPVIDDADIAALLAQARQVYALAIEANDLAAANKANRTIERLLRRPGKPGRPVAERQEPATKTQHAEGNPARVDALVAAILTEADLADLEATWGNDAPPWGRVTQISVESTTT